MKPFRFLPRRNQNRIAGASLAFAAFLTVGLVLPALSDSIQPGTAPYRRSVTGAGNSHSPVFSADGRFIAFVSQANNLATNDDLGPSLDLFTHDLVTHRISLVSVSAAGRGGANADVRAVALSADGQFVAFETAASNLVAGDTNWTRDIYLRDQTAGRTTLVSVNAAGTGPGNGPSYNPLLSEDGRFVVFESLASDLVPNDFNGTNDIFIRDLALGVTTLASVNAAGTAAPAGPSFSPSISANGRTVAFVSQATNIVLGVTNQLGEVYVRDAEQGSNRWAVASHRLATWYRGPASGQPQYYRASEPTLTPDGRYVFFKAAGATVRFDLQRPTNTVVQLFTNDVLSASVFEDNPRLSLTASTAPLAPDPTGHYLVYESGPGVSESYRGIVRVDWETFQTNSTFVFVGGTSGSYYQTNIGPVIDLVATNSFVSYTLSESWQLSWSRVEQIRFASGTQQILFLANVTNLGGQFQASSVQLFSCSIPLRTIYLVSARTNGQFGPSLDGVEIALGANGSGIAWDTPDASLIEGDLNRSWDVILRNLQTAGTSLISQARIDAPSVTADGPTRLDRISLSADGRRVAYVSSDSSLTPGDTNGFDDVFVRDTVAGTNVAVSLLPTPPPPIPTSTPLFSTNAAGSPILSADGRYVAFVREQRVFQATNRIILRWDLLSSSNRLIGLPLDATSLSLPEMSMDSRLVAYAAFVLGRWDVYSYTLSRPVRFGAFNPDVPGAFGSNPLLISATPGSARGNQMSLNPKFSPDGNWIVFQSLASDLVAEYPVNSGEFQLFARRVGCDDATCATNLALANYRGPVRLASYSGSSSNIGTQPLLGGATNPVFSANSRYVAFESRPRQIHRHDLDAPLIKNVVPVGGAFFTNYSRAANKLVCHDCAAPSMSSDGNLVAYEAVAAGTTNILLADLQTGGTQLISVSASDAGAGGNGPSSKPILSPDGRFVVFTSKASNLVPHDYNQVADVFVRDRWNNVTRCLSRNGQDTATGNRVSSFPVLSADGRTVAFQSFATDLVSGDYNETRDVFIVTLAGPDSDGDGLDDELELAYFNTLSRDGTGDFDGDGVTDSSEIRLGMNPADGSSVLAVLAVSTANFGLREFGFRTTMITWRAAPGKRYQAQHRADLENAPWTDLGEVVVAAGTEASQYHVTQSSFGSPRTGFYRVKALE